MRRSVDMLRGHGRRTALAGLAGLLLSATVAQAAGGLDSHFGAGGRVRLQLGVGREPSSEAFGGAIDQAGHLVATGNATNGQDGLNLLIVRYLSNGALDSSFGFGGSVITQVGLGPFPSSNGIGVST